MPIRRKKIQNQVVRRLRWFRYYTRHISLPGFRKVPAYYVLSKFFEAIFDSGFYMRASAMAFSFFFAVFPTVIFLFTLLPYVPIDNLAQEVEAALQQTFPPQAFELLLPTIQSTFKKQGLGTISLAFVLILFAATRGLQTMINAFSKSEPELFRRRGFIEFQLTSLGLFFTLVFFVILSTALLITGEVLLHYMADSIESIGDTYAFWLSVLNNVLHLFTLLGIVAIIYYVAPNVQHKWRLYSPGVWLAGLLLFAAEKGLAWYFSNFANYNRVYGTLAAVMVLMVWFYWISVVLLIGFEINASIDHAAADHEKAMRKLYERHPEWMVAYDQPAAKMSGWRRRK